MQLRVCDEQCSSLRIHYARRTQHCLVINDLHKVSLSKHGAYLTNCDKYGNACCASCMLTITRYSLPLHHGVYIRSSRLHACYPFSRRSDGLIEDIESLRFVRNKLNHVQHGLRHFETATHRTDDAPPRIFKRNNGRRGLSGEGRQHRDIPGDEKLCAGARSARR